MKNSTNTVIIGTEEYNRLRDFHRDIKEKKVIHLYGSNSYVSFTESQEVARLNNELFKIHEELYDLKKQTGRYEVEDVNRFSIFEFLRWKKNNRKSNRFNE